METNKIWYNNPSILLDKPTEIFPYKYSSMESIEDKLNSIIRLLAVGLVGLFIIRYDMFIRSLIIAIIIAIIIVVYYENLKPKETFINPLHIKKENFTPMDYPYSYQNNRGEDVTTKILNNIKKEYQFNEMPNQDHIGYFNQIDRDNTKYNIVQKGHLLFKRNLL